MGKEYEDFLKMQMSNKLMKKFFSFTSDQKNTTENNNLMIYQL